MGIQIIGQSGTITEVEPNDKKQLRVNIVNRGIAFGVSAVTGTMTAALAANSTVFAMRLDPGATNRAFVERLRFQFTTITAFTTAVDASRRLALFRGSGAAATGGTSLASAVPKHTITATSELDAANGGDIRIATTGTLTTAGITFETNPIRLATLSHVGAAGGHYENVWEFHPSENAPVVLEPGQLLAIRNPNAMGAAGTWILSVNFDWHESSAF